MTVAKGITGARGLADLCDAAADDALDDPDDERSAATAVAMLRACSHTLRAMDEALEMALAGRLCVTDPGSPTSRQTPGDGCAYVVWVAAQGEGPIPSPLLHEDLDRASLSAWLRVESGASAVEVRRGWSGPVIRTFRRRSGNLITWDDEPEDDAS